MRIIRFLFLTFILMFLSLGFQTLKEINANLPVGFFEVGEDFQIGSRWVRFLSSANDMSKLSDTDNFDAIFIVTNHIDMRGQRFTPMSEFSGIIYGFGHTISNLEFYGRPLLILNNSGVIEGLHFENIEIGEDSDSTSALMIGSNGGTIRNISYSVSNTSNQLSIVPPLIGENDEGTINKILGSYDLNIDHSSLEIDSFEFFGLLGFSEFPVNDVWLSGQINITQTGIISYQTLHESTPMTSENICIDTISFNAITPSGLNEVSLNNCMYTIDDRIFNLTGIDLDEIDFPSLTFEDELAIIDYLLLGPNAPLSDLYWELSEDTLRLRENPRLNFAGSHVIELTNHSNEIITLNLYQTPFFNSNLLNFSQFTLGSPIVQGPYDQLINYSTNYSRILVNDEIVSSSGNITSFGLVEIRLESDYGLPTLNGAFQITPQTNLGQSNVQNFGFIPTTSVGDIIDQNGQVWTNTPMIAEGDYTLRISLGGDSVSYSVRILPDIEGVEADQVYTEPVTPIIRALRVQINDEEFFSDQTFFKVGTYNVEFPNLPSSNFQFEIDSQLEISQNEVLAPSTPITIPKNYTALRLNNKLVDEEFLISFSAIVDSNEDAIIFRPPIGNHRIQIEGVNGYLKTYNIDVNPNLNVVLLENNHRRIEFSDAELYIDGELHNRAQFPVFTEVGNYQVALKIPDTSIALNAGEFVLEQTITVDPVLSSSLMGTFIGSVRPNIQGVGMNFTLNGEEISQEVINQEINIPGSYEIVIQGRNDYMMTLNFDVSIDHNITRDTYYDLKSLELSAPNNIVLFEGESTPFDFSIDVIAVGTYRVFSHDNTGRRISVKTFEIKPYLFESTLEDYLLTIRISELHPHVDFIINNQAIDRNQDILEFEKIGRYVIQLNSNTVFVQDVPLNYYEEFHIIEPLFDRDILPVSNVLERYRLLNDAEQVIINGRSFRGSQFNENSDIFINRNGLNEIVIQGVNGELFFFEAIFENPHYQNALRLLWPAIIFGVLSAISLSLRFLGVYRHDS